MRLSSLLGRQRARFLVKLSLVTIVLSTAGAAALAGHPQNLAVDDGTSVGKRSIAGTGHAVWFETTDDSQYLRTVRIYGSRYGAFESPPDRFHVWLCDADFKVISDFRFPLARFERGKPRWVDLEIEPTRVPRKFIVCAGFNPTAHQGVYVHFDAQGSGHSSMGLPGRPQRPFDQGDWMIRVEVDQVESAGSWRATLGPFLGTREALYLLNLIIAALAISALGLLAAKLAREQRPRLRHGLLCSALGLLLICPLALAVANRLQVGALPVGVERATQDQSDSTIAVRAANGATNRRDDTNGRQSAGKRQVAAGIGGRADAANAAGVRPASPARIIRRLAQAMALAWIVGAVVVLARWARAMFAIRRLRRSLEPNDCPRLAALCAQAFRTVGLARGVPLGTSALAPGPLVLGAWSPVIVLPEGIDRALGDDELVCVLAHEAAHVARRDALVAVVQRLAGAAFWWNPLLHAVNRRIHYLRECICDDCAVRACGDGDRLAVALLKIADWCLSPRKELASAAMLFDEDNLRSRIARLTQGERAMNARFNPTAIAALLVFTILAPAFVFVPALRAQTKPAARRTKISVASAKQSKPGRLSYNDGTAEGKRSIAGTGEMISFTLPDEKAKIAGIRIHGSRYGRSQAPKERFMIYFLNSEMSDIVATKTAPYSRFKRGPNGWVEIRFPKPIEVPKEFWICVDFRAAQTKGVYVSIDDSTDGSHSRTGLPGMDSRKANIKGDWMIEALLAK